MKVVEVSVAVTDYYHTKCLFSKFILTMIYFC